MDIDQLIRDALMRLGGKVGPAPTIIGKVKSVDEDEKTCVIIETIGDDEIEIDDVRLRPVLNGNAAITIYPKVNSYVLALRIEGSEEWMVAGVDKTDKVKWEVGDCKFEVDEGFLIKRGNDTLKDIIQMIIEATQQIVVLYGNNPDYSKLAQALSKLNLVLK